MSSSLEEISEFQVIPFTEVSTRRMSLWSRKFGDEEESMSVLEIVKLFLKNLMLNINPPFHSFCEERKWIVAFLHSVDSYQSQYVFFSSYNGSHKKLSPNE